MEKNIQMSLLVSGIKIDPKTALFELNSPHGSNKATEIIEPFCLWGRNILVELDSQSFSAADDMLLGM